MGCTNGKSINEEQKQIQIAEKLIACYESIEKYIQQQRETTFNYLSNTGDHSVFLETSSQRSTITSLASDVNLFRKYKKISSIKYSLSLTKFLKSMKQCIFKMQQTQSLHKEFNASMDAFKNTIKGQAYIKKNQQKLTYIENISQTLTTYFATLSQSLSLDNDTQHTTAQMNESKNYNTLETNVELEELQIKKISFSTSYN